MASPFGNQRAHRASWAYHNEEPVPEGKLVCHRCDNRSCINPDHLFIGTHADNNADKVAKGRDRRPDRYNPRRGETTHNAKMDDYSVVSARWMHETFGFSMRSLAKYFGVTYTNMRAILLRKAWSHVK